MNDDGTMAKGNELQQFKERHQLKMITIESLINYRRKQESEGIELKATVKCQRILVILKCMVFNLNIHEDIVVLGKENHVQLKM